MTEKLIVLSESLRRTDSYILAADQKASITLASGVTFLGIYVSIFYNIMDKHFKDIPIALTVSIAGVALTLWILWFDSIRGVFTPRVSPSETKSIISFASITKGFNSSEQYKDYYKLICESGLDKIEIDLIENHWICANICMEKMRSFSRSLTLLSFALAVSLLGLAFIAFYLQFLKTG